jgi:hypothetical protein
MSVKDKITKIAESLPPPLQTEGLHFLEYLASRAAGEEFNGMLWSYSVLAEDWLSPEDEEAWKDL